MRKPYLYTSIVVSTLAIGAAACSGTSDNSTPSDPFTYQVTPSIQPNAKQIANGRGGAPRPLATYADAKGIKTDFVANEVVIKPQDTNELNAFLAAYGGTVVANDALPTPPAALHRKVNPALQIPHSYTVRVTQFSDVNLFLNEGQNKNMKGAYKFSGDDAIRLIALTTHEKLAGRKISPNWAYHGTSGMLHSTQEAQNPDNTYQDAFAWTPFKGPVTFNSSRSNVFAAWEFLTARGYTPNSVPIAVIDGGFWLLPNGQPDSSFSIGTDLPSNPIQYNFDDDSYFAGGVNPANCTGGSTCNWHGNGSVGTAAGLINNQAAAAGSGGLVAMPMLFKTASTDDQIARAVRTAAQWGAQIMSMSFGTNCNEDCRDTRGGNDFNSAISDAIGGGAILIAAAGNDGGNDVEEVEFEPCVLDGVICVGALADGTNTRISYSNRGSRVNVWAPTDIPVMPNGDDPTRLANHSGTSASTPFVAGVVAMMKSVNPTLNGAQTLAILQQTAWKEGAFASADPDVAGTGYLNALGAVRSSAGNKLPDDLFEPNNTPSTPKVVSGGLASDKLTLNPGQPDYYRLEIADYSNVSLNLEYMKGLGYIFFSISPESGSGTIFNSKEIDSDRGMTYSASLAPGTYLVELSAFESTNYNLNLTINATGLNPDQFEINNTIDQATPIGAGQWNVNLHSSSDVDYYKVTIPSTLSHEFTYTFNVENSDYPVNVEKFDSTTAYLGTQSGTSVESSFDSTNLGKTFYFRVSGPKTRYTVGTGIHIPSSGPNSPANPWAWSIDPTGPVSVWHGELTGPDQWLSFAVNPIFQNITLMGSSLTLGLYDTSGNHLVDAVAGRLAGPSVETQPVQVLKLKGNVTAGQTYLLRVGRADQGPNPNGAGSSSVQGIVTFSLKAN